MSTIRTRFAPSPTGFLHVGGLRTALYSYLYAQKNQGTFLLRIEDTDQERLVEGAIESMINSMRWAGVAAQEGVSLDTNKKIIQTGDKGPYIQSERLPLYQKYAEELLTNGHAYYCFCTKERLDEVRKFQELNKLPTGYDGHCRTGELAEARARVQAGESSVIRLKMPKEGVTSFVDLIRGPVEFKNALVDDQVLLKSDGFPTYHLAVVVDDHLMEITQVIRGEEWISSTPKHIKLFEMFGWTPPAYGHLSLLVNEQKQKLSKRHGDVSVEDFKEKGYLPEALVNFVAFLGWNPGDERELFSLTELAQEFSLEKVSKPAAVFNREKLNWYNKQYMMKLDLADLVERTRPFMRQAGLNEAAELPTEKLAPILDLERGRANTLVELVSGIGFAFATKLDYDAEILVWKKGTKEEAKQIFGELLELLPTVGEWTKENLDTKLQAFIAAKAYGVGNVMWPLRVALSGAKNSPGPTELAHVLGLDETLKRIQAATAKL